MNIDFSHLISLAKKLGISFLVFTFCRFSFYFFNSSFFNDGFPIDAFYYGLRFDWVAISYLFSPFILLSILPFGIRYNKSYKIVIKLLFHIANTIGVIFNLIDLGYYQFALKRTTADFFRFVSTNDDTLKLLPQYLADFWYAFVLLIILISFTEFLYRKSESPSILVEKSTKNAIAQLLFFIGICGLTAIGFRGGLQLKPLDIINAANNTSPQNVPLVLNTPFCIIKTVLNDQLPVTDFFTPAELPKIYSPAIKLNDDGLFKNKNVVLIILESFAKEYVGYFNNGSGFTPFLDSLINESYAFTNAYSNGSKSIEALPSILAGIPPLMNTPYVISNYSNNKIDALPSILKNNGYNTSFYHGGSNGTMGFNGFTKIAGVDNYFGMDEYPNKEKDYDGHWGIFDEPYLQYFSNQLNKTKEPFFSAVFTLSSHHPYSIPKKYENKFPVGILDAHETIGYTDYSLREFFNNSKKSEWFKNTLFVFTADHSVSSLNPEYGTLIGRFAIPLFIYDPSSTLKGVDTNYFQHCDITPTVLSLLGINSKIISFGLPLNKSDRFVVGFSRNTFYLLKNDYLLLFDSENTTGLYNYASDKLLARNLLNDDKYNNIKVKLEKELKAIIQQHNNRLIDNKLSISNIK
ncbi:sulfatase-like hydrolase/transferase [Vicingus serpentipes]|uniref:Sulfatase-like hydrolase/transferase n=1 Tax=Vicingus serpentipes TaxID=1926625 RepID=A0A5C6RX20_9FLAO|nr:alkaline phosphatase family protein [Vicingus serpentipes]TXB66637.1 sulfatase-like hydrolase/transferase [Vicingus serpentipes]